MAYRILIADDDPAICLTFQKALRFQPWEVEIVDNGAEALEHLCRRPFDVALLDLYMPRMDGIEVLRVVRRKGIRTDVVLMSGFGTIDKAVQAIKDGALVD